MTPQELIEQTKQLIAIPSTADNPIALRRAVDFVADIAGSSPNVTIERFESGDKPSFLAYRGKLRPAEFDLLLNAHVDVVPGRPEQFEAFESDGKLYGRGALDMKGTAVALTDAFCEFVNVVPYRLGLQIVSDEELGGVNGAAFQIKQGVRAKFVLLGEYVIHRNAIYPAARGVCWVDLNFPGKKAHSGYPWKGSNAVARASNFVRAVLRHYPVPEEERWVTTANVASLNTLNQTYNQVPDSATLKIDFRFIPEDPVFQNYDSLRAFIASIDQEADLVRVPDFTPAVNTDRLNPFVQGLSKAMLQITGKDPQYLARSGASDARHFKRVNNPVVEFGLYGQDPHSDSEYVELSSFAEYQAIMREFLLHPTWEQSEAKSKIEAWVPSLST